MTRHTMTVREVAVMYDQLRRRYFTDAETLRTGTVLHVPPPANQLTFGWLPDNSNAMAMTEFDEDETPHLVRISPKYARRTLVRESLLHELTHIRLGPGPNCGGYVHGWDRCVAGSRAWQRETVRLAIAGAIRL